MDAHNGNELATGRGKHDIVGNLPLELVAQVTEYLDIVDIVRCHRVRDYLLFHTAHRIDTPKLTEVFRSQGNGA